MAIAFVVSPYVAYKIHERAALLARVPEPLKVAAIEYRLEASWGMGGPGDNETGFVVYRLTASSTEWALSRGANLGSMLAAEAEERWRPTPVGEDGSRNTWHPNDNSDMGSLRPEPHPPTIEEFLERYGFMIPVEKGVLAEVDRVILAKGSFYYDDGGGSITIVDPQNGKVYFAHAG